MADLQLIIYTKLLKYRIAHSGRIDVNILNLSEAERPSNYNEHPGRFVSWFIAYDDRPGLIILAREKIGGNISHACIIYTNTNHEDFPLLERSALCRKLNYEPKLAVINIRSKTARFCEYSVLLESIQCVITRDIFREVPPLYIVLEGLGSLKAPRDMRSISTRCSLDLSSETIAIRQFMVTRHLMMVDLDQAEPIPGSFNIMRMRYDGHYIYGINYRHEQTMFLLLPHIEQFPEDLYFVELEERIERLFPDQYKTYYSARPRFVSECNSTVILKICILLTQIPLFYIDPSDVDAILQDLGILSVERSQRPSPRKASQFSKSAYEREYRGSKPVMTLKLSAESQRPEVLSVKNRRPSREASLNSQQAIRRDINAYRAWMAVADNITSPYPSTSESNARNVPRGTVLTDFDWFQEQLRFIVRYWEKFEATKLMQPVLVKDLRIHNFENRAARFIIVPIVSEGENRDVSLLILDKELKTWRWMSPNNSAAKFNEIAAYVKNQVMPHFPDYQSWEGDLIILTSSYHKDYPYAHLLMGVYRVAQYFQCTIKHILPIKVVYNEESFRDYVYHACLAVQLANQQHNLERGLVTESEELLDGAYVSLPSPVQYERSVVPSNLCPFCKRRRYDRLGRHIYMDHGGQAKIANVARLVQYGYFSKSEDCSGSKE